MLLLRGYSGSSFRGSGFNMCTLRVEGLGGLGFDPLSLHERYLYRTTIAPNDESTYNYPPFGHSAL